MRRPGDRKRSPDHHACEAENEGQGNRFHRVLPSVRQSRRIIHPLEYRVKVLGGAGEGAPDPARWNWPRRERARRVMLRRHLLAYASKMDFSDPLFRLRRGPIKSPAVALLLLLATPALAAVSGIVFVDLNQNGVHDAGEPPRGNVVVSNGLDVVRTDAEGRYSLAKGPRGFVFVTRPAGFDCERWYRRQAGDFALTRQTAEEEFFFVHMSDLHVYDRSDELIEEFGLGDPWWAPSTLVAWFTLRRINEMLVPRFSLDPVEDLRNALAPYRDVGDLSDTGVYLAYRDGFQREGSKIGNVRGKVEGALEEIAALRPGFVLATGDLVLDANRAPDQALIGGVEREVRALTVRTERERGALALLRDGLQSTQGEAVPASLTADVPVDQRAALRRVRSFQAASELLHRRTSDLERLSSEYGATMGSLEQARTAQVRLGEEVRVLAAELESLDARKAAARTRSAVGDSTIAGSGFAAAQERIKKIRSAVREQNKLLQYYEYERVVHVDTVAAMALETPADAVTAIEEALAAYPGK